MSSNLTGVDLTFARDHELGLCLDNVGLSPEHQAPLRCSRVNRTEGTQQEFPFPEP